MIAASGVVRPLLVSHEMIGRMLLRNLLDLAPAEALAYGHPHGVVYRVDVSSQDAGGDPGVRSGAARWDGTRDDRGPERDAAVGEVEHRPALQRAASAGRGSTSASTPWRT